MTILDNVNDRISAHDKMLEAIGENKMREYYDCLIRMHSWMQGYKSARPYEFFGGYDDDSLQGIIYITNIDKINKDKERIVLLEKSTKSPSNE